MPELTLFARPEELRPFAEEWDVLVSARGVQSDIFDTHAWLASWLDASGASIAARLRVPAVIDNGRLVAALPLLAGSLGMWKTPGLGCRPRCRPVVEGTVPAEEDLEALAASVRRAGARVLTMPGAPLRDPATTGFVRALIRAGYQVTVRPLGQEWLALAPEGWEGYRARVAEFEREVGRKLRRAQRLGPIEVHRLENDHGYRIFFDLHRQSWKGPMRPPFSTMRTTLWSRAIERGWLRFWVLSVSGVPIAFNMGFRFPDLVTFGTTAYAESVRALGPGSILGWKSLLSSFEDETPPKVVDFLPGEGPHKNTLAPDCAGRALIEAVARRSMHVMVRPVWRQGERAGRLLGARLSPKPAQGPERRTVPAEASAVAVQRLWVGPGGPHTGASLRPLDPALEVYLAVAGSFASIEGMKRTWNEQDQWVETTSPPALVRIAPEGSPRAVREIVLVPSERRRLTATAGDAVTLERVLGAVANAIGEVVAADLTPAAEAPIDAGSAPAVVRAPQIPWLGAAGGADAPPEETDGYRRTSKVRVKARPSTLRR